MSSSPGPRTSLGKYKIEALLGKGGMGEVYKAYDPSLDRTIALKTIRAEAEDPRTLERFRREGRAAGRLKHPLIVTVYDLGEAEGTMFMAMEYLEGRSLAAALDEGSLSFDTKLRVLTQVLDALEYAHGQGVVHRDIKPSNVQLLPDGSIKILDFGIARVLTADSMSRTGSVVGTPFYMAPEQLRGQKVDRRADIYSTGVLGYELLTRRRPFDGESLTEVIFKVINEPVKPMNTAWSHAFPEVDRLMARAMEKSPDERYPTAQEMADAIRAFLQAKGAAIARVQEDLEKNSRQVLAEGKSLAAEGRLPESIQLLAGLSQRNPDAVEARALLSDLKARIPTAPGEDSGDQPTEIVQRAVAPPPAAPPVPLPPASPRRGVNPLLLAAALVSGALVLGVVATVLFMRQGPSAAGGSRVVGVAPSTTGPSGEEASPPAPSSTASPSGPSPPSGLAPAPVGPPPTPPAVSAKAGPAPVVAQRPAGGGAGWCVEASSGGGAHGELAGLLREALRTRGLAVRSSCAEAAVALRVKADVSVRPSPFSAASARTADYVGVLEVRSPGEGGRRFDFDGHAMEFGENVARAAALRELADKMAERVLELGAK